MITLSQEIAELKRESESREITEKNYEQKSHI